MRYLTADNTVERYELHAACEPTAMDGDLVSWIDLDLDVILEDGTVKVLDEAAFMEHADTMHYPEHVVRTAWSGIAAVTPRFINREWPFDGSEPSSAREGVPGNVSRAAASNQRSTMRLGRTGSA